MRMVMSRGPDERSQMHAMSALLSTCEGMSDRLLCNEGDKLDTAEQEQNSWCERSLQFASIHNLWSCEGAREIKLCDRNGMIALGRIRERFGETAGVAKLSDVFHFQWTS